MSATLARSRPHSRLVPGLAALAIGVAALIAAFWPECRAAVRVWEESTAYGHCFLVIPIALYLVWERRDSLRGLVPRPNLAFAILGLPLPFAWLAANRLGIMEGRQLVAIAFLELLFLVVLGWQLFRRVLGPMLYLVFLVPFGAFLTYPLQTFTAHFIDTGLDILAIPHFVTDMTIEISAGTFFVAEACAGLRFLIASVAFGVFFALLNYRSNGRRAGFIAASIAVPIIANGFRALGIVVLGHVLGSAEAAAADHIIYGWVFFSFVMLLLVAAGLPFRQPEAPPPPRSEITTASQPWPWAAAIVLVLAFIGPAAAMAIDRSAQPGRLASLPALTAPNGCQIAPTSNTPDRALYTLTCDDRTWSITLQTLPPRSTGAAVADARNRMVGTLDMDEATTTGIPGEPAWQAITSRSPPLVIGTAAWVEGQPARGGIAQRLQMARTSITGAAYAPLVMSIALRPDTPAHLDAAQAELTRIIDAQPDLTKQMETITRQ